MNEITSEQYASLGKVLFEAFQLSDQQGLDCPIIKLIEDCEECPFGKACDLILELEKSNQALNQGDDRTQKKTASCPQIDTHTIIEFLSICEEPLAIETRQMLIDLIQSLSKNAAIGLAAMKAKQDKVLCDACWDMRYLTNGDWCVWCECKEFCRVLDEHDRLEAEETDLPSLQGQVGKRVRGLVEALEDIQRSGTGREGDGTISMTVEAVKAQSALAKYRNV